MRKGNKMLDEETYRKEIVRMWDTIRTDEHAGERSCKGVRCGDCPLYTKNDICNNIDAFEFIKVIEEWSKEHPQKHKVSKLEYDILDAYTNLFDFGDVKMLNFSLFDRLHEIGYFKGVTKDMYIKDYFNNCEVDRRK